MFLKEEKIKPLALASTLKQAKRMIEEAFSRAKVASLKPLLSKRGMIELNFPRFFPVKGYVTSNQAMLILSSFLRKVSPVRFEWKGERIFRKGGRVYLVAMLLYRLKAEGRMISSSLFFVLNWEEEEKRYLLCRIWAVD